MLCLFRSKAYILSKELESEKCGQLIFWQSKLNALERAKFQLQFLKSFDDELFRLKLTETEFQHDKSFIS